MQLFWSCKEAAYKAHQRRFNLKRAYNPLQFQYHISSVKTDSTILGLVKIEDHLYFTVTTHSPGCIHSIATPENQQPVSLKIFRHENDLKAKLFREYSLLLKERQSNFSIQKNEQFIPFLFIENNKTEQAFSLSHHGKYAAFAISLMNCQMLVKQY